MNAIFSIYVSISVIANDLLKFIWQIGQLAMSAAAINDVVAWVLLALAVAITNSGSTPLVAVWVLLLGIAFLAFMFLVVSPVMHALAHHSETPTEPVIAVTLLLVLGAAFLTDLIGIHVIFGAFICGLIIPQESPFSGGSICSPWHSNHGFKIPVVCHEQSQSLMRYHPVI